VQELKVKVSIGTATVLGLADMLMDVAPTTAYLMVGGRCALACRFCAQARDSRANALALSRITWPEYPLHEIMPRLATAVSRGAFRRACLQVTVAPGYFDTTLTVVQAIRAICDVPVDAAILPRDLHQVEALLAAGVDHIGFGLDAACERVFRRVKEGSWKRSLRLIEETARRFPGRSAVHLIVGLGETEQEMTWAIQHFHDLELVVGLFAFTPVRGTALENQPPPPLGQYRRMQVACHLISHGLTRAETFAYDATGRLSAFNVPNLAALLADGTAFQTSGCPDCNRPYYNERPGGVMYNYPRPLTPTEVAEALAMLGGGE